MNPSTRNLWLELGAIGLVLLSLIFFLGAAVQTATFVVNGMLPGAAPIQRGPVVIGWREALIGATPWIFFGACLISAGWGLRFLLVPEPGGPGTEGA